MSLFLPYQTPWFVKSKTRCVEHLPTLGLKNHPSLKHFAKCKLEKVYGAIVSNETFATIPKISETNCFIVLCHGLLMNVLSMATQLWPNGWGHVETNHVPPTTQCSSTNFLRYPWIIDNRRNLRYYWIKYITCYNEKRRTTSSFSIY